MPFKITARTILQLGSELISSDAVAIYELIKNAFDAGSPEVEVRFIVRLPYLLLNTLTQRITFEANSSESTKEQLRKDIIQELSGKIDSSAPGAQALSSQIKSSKNLNTLAAILKQSNYIQFIDAGEGMSLSELDDVYLTIGTRSRKKLKGLPENNEGAFHNNLSTKRPILGEKGLGRLSVMRLGDGLHVETSRRGDAKYSLLDIDWSVFSHDSDALLESIDIKPTDGGFKPDINDSGTTITVYDLHSEWTEEAVKSVAKEQLRKFIDPFGMKNRNFMELWFNDSAVPIGNVHKLLFENAHAECSIEFKIVNNEPSLSGTIYYRLYRKTKAINISGEHLESLAETSKDTLIRLGPFTMQFYWFNNRIIREVDGIGKMQDVRNLIKEWAGGLMVYRDGFRIFPYGGFEDDWLKLDDTAFSSGGYKVNRRQVVGKVDISSSKNKYLIDQTNREGLSDCPEKQALINILQHVMWKQFKTFLNEVEKDRLTNEPLDLNELGARIIKNESRLSNNLDTLIKRFPEIKSEKKIIDDIRETIIKTRSIFNEAEIVMHSFEERRDVTIHLAGLGLMVDIVAHELNRSTKHALDTINYIDESDLTKATSGLVNNLRTQLKALQTRLKVLDPLGPSGRNTKTTFSLTDLITQSFNFHQNQFDRHHIKWTIESIPVKDWQIKAVQGMFVQIIENLISNSVYWLKFKQLRNPGFKAHINVVLDYNSKSIYFTDNGPGIPREQMEEVFQPFVTTKPPDAGKGLGLYISREIAKYHNATLSLDGQHDTLIPYLNTFVLTLNT